MTEQFSEQSPGPLDTIMERLVWLDEKESFNLNKQSEQCPFCPLWFGVNPSLWNATQSVSVAGVECCESCEKTLSGMPQDEQNEYVVLARKAQEAIR
jgi:hypothetical protein